MTPGPVDPDYAVDLPDEQDVAGARPHRRFDVLAAIALGGGLGSVARYLVASALPVHPGRFPWSTFLVNLGGSFLLGVLMVFVLEVWPPRRYVRPFAGVGVLGGFTTFSTFAVEVRGLAADGSWGLAGAYALTSLAGGVAVAWCGIALSRLSLRERREERTAEGGLP
jgi:CrcB protein